MESKERDHFQEPAFRPLCNIVAFHRFHLNDKKVRTLNILLKYLKSH